MPRSIPTPLQYALWLTALGNGSVAKDPDKATYNDGEAVKQTATPVAGWAFSGWSGDAEKAPTQSASP